MRAKFLSNLFLLLLLNIVVKPFWLLGVDREVQNALGPTDYGLYFTLLNFSILFSSLLDMGISSYNSRNIAQHQFLIGKYFPKLINIKAALSLVYAAVILCIGFGLGYRGQSMFLLMILAGNQVLISLILFLRSNIAALLLFKKDSVVSVLDKLLLIGFCGALLWYNDGVHLNVTTFIFAQTAAYGLTVLVAFLFLVGKLNFKKKKFRPQSYLALVKESYPYAILVLLMAIYSRTDVIMVERLLPEGAKQAGIYAQGFRILEAFSMIAYLFSTLLLPLFAKMLKERKSVDELVLTATKLLGVFSISAAVVCSFFSDFIISELYTNEQVSAIPIFQGLIFSLIPISVTYIFGTLLTASGNMKLLNKMAIFGVLLNLSLNFIFIPIFEVEGAVLATLFTQGLTAIVQVVACFVILKVTMQRSAILRLIAFVVLAVLGVYLVANYNAALPGFVIASLLLPTLGILLGVLNFQSFLQLIKSRGK